MIKNRNDQIAKNTFSLSLLRYVTILILSFILYLHVSIEQENRYNAIIYKCQVNDRI